MWLPAIALEIDRAVLPAYLRFGYVPAPRSIYAGVQKLMPGHVLTLPWRRRGACDAVLVARSAWSSTPAARRRRRWTTVKPPTRSKRF